MAHFDFSAYITQRTLDFTGREWAFAEIDHWLGDVTGSRYFIITGGPGTGKSAIAARLAQFAAGAVEPPLGCMHIGQEFLQAVHFCIAHQSDTVDALNFVRAVASQLMRIDGFAQRFLEEQGVHIETLTNVWANYGQVIGVQIQNLTVKASSAQAVFNELVMNPLKQLDAGGYHGPVMIMVDALDEAVQAGRGGADTIVDLLAGAQNLPGWVRFVLTSRPEGTALSYFEERKLPLFKLDAGHAESEQDLHAYLDRRIADSEKLRAQLTMANQATEAFATRVLEASAGNFLYLVWLLRAVEEGHQAVARLDALPVGLDGIYRDFLRTRNVGRDVRDVLGAWRSIYRPALGVLAAAREPLTAEQVGRFAGLDAQATADVLDDVQQFLAELEGGRYRLYHRSLADFLGSRERARDFWIDASMTHRRIAKHYRGKAESWAGVDWSRVDDYGVLHLGQHLYALRDDPELRAELYGLICKPFMEEKHARTHSLNAFDGDVSLMIKVARDDTIEESIAQELRGNLIQKTIRELSTVPPETLYALALLGQTERALAIGSLSRIRRDFLYRVIGEALLEQEQKDKAGRMFLQGLENTSHFGGTIMDAEEFASLAPDLVKVGEFHRLVAEIDKISDAMERGKVCSRVACKLSDAQFHREALELAHKADACVRDAKVGWLGQSGFVKDKLEVWGPLPAVMVAGGEHDEALRIAAEITEIEKTGEHVQLLHPTVKVQTSEAAEIAVSLARAGRREEAERSVEQVLAGTQRAKRNLGMVQSWSAASRALARVGRTTEATCVADYALSIAQTLEKKRERWPALCEVVGSLAVLQDFSRALVLADEIISPPEQGLAIAYIAEAMLESGRNDDAVEQVKRVLQESVEKGVLRYGREWGSFSRLDPVFKVLSRMISMWVDAGATDVARSLSRSMYYATWHVSSDEPYEVHALSLLAKTLALVGEPGLSFKVAQATEGLDEHDDSYQWRTLGWSAQAFAAAGQIARGVELAKRAWVDRMWQSFHYHGPMAPEPEDMLGAMVESLANSKDSARHLIDTALTAANAVHTKDSFRRIAGLIMVSSGFFSLGLYKEAIEICRQINESLCKLETDPWLPETLNSLANVLLRAHCRPELTRMLNEKWRRCEELQEPYDFLKTNAEFIAYIDDGMMLWTICRELMDVEAW